MARLRMLKPPMRLLHAPVKILQQAHGSKRQVKGRHLQKRRLRILAAQPLCVDCMAIERVRIAQEIDHRVPLAEGGQDVEDNLQPLCKRCHAAKTERERKRRRGGGLARSLIDLFC